MPPATTALPPGSTLDAGPEANAGDEHLHEVLKRCPPSALEAARRFHRTGDMSCVPILVRAVIGRYIAREHRARLENGPGSLRLIEDLGVDSLTMLEIVMLAEEVLSVSLDNEELRNLRTLDDVQTCIVRLLGEEAAPRPVEAG